MRLLHGFVLAICVLLCLSLTEIGLKTEAQSDSAGTSSFPNPESRAPNPQPSQPGTEPVRAIVTDGASGKVIPDSKLTFTTIDVPGAAVTSVQGINTAGVMVGLYAETDASQSRGFLLSGGNFTYLDYPGAYATATLGINDSNLIVGYAQFQRGAAELGFLFDGTTFTPVRDGSDTATVCWGINNAGLVVGGAGTVFGTKGFELRGHAFQNISPPGTYVYVYATGINKLGEVVGWDGPNMNGFAYANGKFKTVDFPGAIETEAEAINDSGVIVGWYFLGGTDYAFASKSGKYISFSFPGALATFATGINASGQIVGEYTVDYSTYHGFVTSPLIAADFQ